MRAVTSTAGFPIVKMYPRYPRLVDSLRGGAGGNAAKRSAKLRASPLVKVHSGFGLPEKTSSCTLTGACNALAGAGETITAVPGISDADDAHALHHMGNRRAKRINLIWRLCR